MRYKYNVLIEDCDGKTTLTHHTNFNLAQRAAIACYKPSHTVMQIIDRTTGLVERDVLNWWEGREDEQL